MEVAHLLGGLTAEEIRGLVGDSPTMLELGANDGEDTRRFLDAMPGIRLFCFEPDPRPATRWIRDIRDPRVQLFTSAIAAQTGPTTLYLSGGSFPHPANPMRDWDRSSGIHPPTGHLVRDKLVTFGRTIMVAGIRLDDWMSLGFTGTGLVDFIWADTQGAERDIILGGRQTLRQTRYLYTEFYDVEQYQGQPNLAEICQMLPQFELLTVYSDGNGFFRNRDFL